MEKELIIEHINTAGLLGLALKRIRKNKGLSQVELAKIMNMRQATISDIENGKGTLDSLFKIVQSLQVNLVTSNVPLLKEKMRSGKPKSIFF